MTDRQRLLASLGSEVQEGHARIAATNTLLEQLRQHLMAQGCNYAGFDLQEIVRGDISWFRFLWLLAMAGVPSYPVEGLVRPELSRYPAPLGRPRTAEPSGGWAARMRQQFAFALRDCQPADSTDWRVTVEQAVAPLLPPLPRWYNVWQLRRTIQERHSMRTWALDLHTLGGDPPLSFTLQYLEARGYQVVPWLERLSTLLPPAQPAAATSPAE
jgi:hypothetical protein